MKKRFNFILPNLQIQNNYTHLNEKYPYIESPIDHTAKPIKGKTWVSGFSNLKTSKTPPLTKKCIQKKVVICAE